MPRRDVRSVGSFEFDLGEVDHGGRSSTPEHPASPAPQHHALHGVALSGLHPANSYALAPEDVSVRTMVLRPDQLVGGDLGAFFAVHAAREHWRSGHTRQAQDTLRQLPIHSLAERGPDAQFAAAALLSSQSQEELERFMPKEAWPPVIDLAFRPPVDMDRVAALATVVERSSDHMLAVRFAARRLHAIVLGRLPFDAALAHNAKTTIGKSCQGANWQSLKDWLTELPIGMLPEDADTRALLRQLDEVARELQCVRRQLARALDREQPVDDVAELGEKRKALRDEQRRLLENNQALNTHWEKLETLDVRLAVLDDDGGRLHDAVLKLFNVTGKRRALLTELDNNREEALLTYAAWSRLSRLEQGRSDPDLEVISGLLASFRTVMERLLHRQVMQAVGRNLTGLPRQLKDVVDGRTTLGIGGLYTLLFHDPQEHERAFVEACRKTPHLVRLLEDEGRERFRALLDVNLDRVHHDEGRSRQAWPEVFRVVRWALYDELRPPAKNQGLVARLLNRSGASATGKNRAGGRKKARAAR